MMAAGLWHGPLRSWCAGRSQSRRSLTTAARDQLGMAALKSTRGRMASVASSSNATCAPRTVAHYACHHSIMILALPSGRGI